MQNLDSIIYRFGFKYLSLSNEAMLIVKAQWLNLQWMADDVENEINYEDDCGMIENLKCNRSMAMDHLKIKIMFQKLFNLK